MRDQSSVGESLPSLQFGQRAILDQPSLWDAAAVTAVGLTRMAMPMERSRRLQVVLDRPFGFVAVHRETRLPIVAGWVADPTQPA